MPEKTMTRKGVYWPWLVLTVLIIVLDQLSKNAVSDALMLHQSTVIFSWLNLTLQYNTGAAFSFLASNEGWQPVFLTALGCVLSLILLIWLYRLPARHTWNAVALSMILGGALGNLIDRFRLGYVIDFIDFHLQTWHFATFNIADSAITVGAMVLVIDLLVSKSKD